METPSQIALVFAAQAGDRTAFDSLVKPYRLFGLLVLGMVGEQIANMVTFLELSSLSPFALPSKLPPL